MPAKSFFADAVLFDMDGTLTDSIAAVEAAWGKVADDIGQDRSYVIAATHGKRAIDNLAQFKPHIKTHEMDDEVRHFEQTILDYADAYHKFGPSSQQVSPMRSSSPVSPLSSGYNTPALSSGPISATSSPAPSRSPSFSTPQLRRPSFATGLRKVLGMMSLREHNEAFFEDTNMAEIHEGLVWGEAPEKGSKLATDVAYSWQIEASGVDRSIRILPGVKRMIESIPEGRYAVATSGAKTYAYGAMTRVGITPPSVTITADDKRLKAGKPAPDPFLLAAECLGFEAKRCVVFEDSPSGIRAGVASGATVIAVCTSHAREKIANCGAHYIVDDMESVRCDVVGEGDKSTLLFTIEQ